MFFIISKILYFIVSPLIWIAAYLLFICVRFKKIQARKHLVLAFLLLFIFGNRFIANNVFRCYETAPVAQSALPVTDVAIVLGGFSYYDFTLQRIHFNKSCDRIFHALQLYKRGFVKKILLSGGSGSLKKPEERESPLIKNYLVSIGFRAEDILVDTVSKNTYENAVECARMLHSMGYENRPQILVSSGYHLPRAMACFKKQGIAFVPYSVDGISGEQKLYPDDLLLPAPWVFELWDLLIHEWMGYAIYFLSGKI